MADLGILEEFTKKYIIRIPSYQRGYAWERKNWDDLKNDILTLDEEYNHYCGPIVYSTTNDSVRLQGPVRESLDIVHIEDGQQRVTTLMLAAWNLARVVEEREDLDNLKDRVKELRRSVVFYAETRGASDSEYTHPRLRSANLDLNRFLEDLFAGRNPRTTNAPTKRLSDMVGYQYKDFSELPSEDLFVLSTRLFEGLKFVFIDLQSENINSHVAFHTINSRGVPLREFDKVKNGIMYAAEQNDGSGELSGKVESEWFNTITSLDEEGLSLNEDDFLGYSYAIHFDKNSRPSTKNLATEILKNFSKASATDSIELVNKAINSWSSYIDAYNFISRANKLTHYQTDPPNTHRNRYIDSLRRLESLKLEEIAKPLLIVAEKCLEEREKAELSSVIEKFVFRVFGVAKKRVDFLRTEILGLAQDLAHSRKSPHSVQIQLLSWIQLYAPLQTAINEMFDTDRMNYRNWEPNRLGYFLLEYEHYLMGYEGHPIIFKDKKKSIEHVCPQQQSGYGSELLSFQALKREWQEAFEGDALKWKYNVHKLGNLCFTAKNSTLGNKSWNEKKQYYSEQDATHGERELESFVIDCWDATSIMKREAKLATFFVKRWNVGLDMEKEVTLPLRFKENDVDAELSEQVDVTLNVSQLDNLDELSEVPEDNDSIVNLD